MASVTGDRKEVAGIAGNGTAVKGQKSGEAHS